MKREPQIKKSRPEPWEPGGRILYCFHRGNLNVGAICGLSAILFVTIILIFLHSKSGSPALGIPVPIELAKLEPQLRAYLEKEIQWARAAPRDANRQATMGIVYSANGLWEEARIAFENAAKLNSNEPLAQLYVGIAKQGIGDLEGAVKTFTQVTTRFPDFPQGYYRLGDALLRMGMIDQAEPAFRRLIDWRHGSGTDTPAWETFTCAKAGMPRQPNCWKRRSR